MSRQTRFDLVLNARGFAWRPAGRHCVWRRRTLPDLARCSYGWRRRPDLPRAADERSPPPGCETRPCPRKQSAPLHDGRDPNLHSPAYHFAALSTRRPVSQNAAFAIPKSHLTPFEADPRFVGRVRYVTLILPCRRSIVTHITYTEFPICSDASQASHHGCRAHPEMARCLLEVVASGNTEGLSTVSTVVPL